MRKILQAVWRGVTVMIIEVLRASLNGAFLRGAKLNGSSLAGADLRRADLVKADLTKANLEGATLNWYSPDLLAELLRRWAGDDPDKNAVINFILKHRDWCWDEFLMYEHPLKVDVLRYLYNYGTGINSLPLTAREYLEE